MDTILIGSEKQQNWARRIMSDLQRRSEQPLPIVPDAHFWIEHRNAQIEEIFADAAARTLDLNIAYTAFTSRYSRYSCGDALTALAQLNHAVVLDCETSGLQPNKKSEIIELAIVEWESGAVLFDSLVRPFHFEGYEAKETAKSREVHNITKDELEHAPTLPDVYPHLSSILVSHPLIAYNDAFDIPMIRRSIAKWGIQPPRLYSTCAMRLFSAFLELDEHFSLEYACDYMHIDRTQFGDAHRALADALATRELLHAMRGR